MQPIALYASGESSLKEKANFHNLRWLYLDIKIKPDALEPSKYLKACCHHSMGLIFPLVSVAAGVPDLLEQRGSRSSEWHRGVQIPVCMGPLELPREGSAAVHTQQPAQR